LFATRNEQIATSVAALIHHLLYAPVTKLTLQPQEYRADANQATSTSPLGNPVTIIGGTASSQVTLASGRHPLKAVCTLNDTVAYLRSSSATQTYLVKATIGSP
jgi:hypothetical protein